MSGYLKSLGIVNFLNHKELLVEFCPGFNVIAGASDSGKSAILRAISWIWQNNPTGDAIKNWDAGKAELVCGEMTFEDPETNLQESIIKERIGSTSSYTLSTLPEPLSVVGRNVPLEALELINFSDLNFKGQHDPYLFSLSSGELAKKINELVGLSDIDVSLKNLNSKASTVKKDCERTSSEIEGLGQDIEKMSYLKALEVDIAEIEGLESQTKSSVDRLNALNKIIGDIKSIQGEIDHNQTILEADAPAQEIQKLLSEWKDKVTRRITISTLIGSIEKISESIKTEESWMEADKPCKELFGSIVALKEKETRIRQIRITVNAILDLELKIKGYGLDIVKKESALTDFLEKTKICPTCGQPFTKIGISMMVKK